MPVDHMTDFAPICCRVQIIGMFKIWVILKKFNL